jgi:hypothetical protein
MSQEAGQQALGALKDAALVDYAIMHSRSRGR